MVDKARILIVDDILSNIKILSSVLRGVYDLSIATSGQECLDFVQNQTLPDLILLDIMMPEMDGYEVCHRLKKNEKTKDIPVIFVTAKTDADNETHGFDCGAVDYITKPISPPIVLARVKSQILIKSQQDQLKKSISIMEHDREILQQKAELGILAGGLAHDLSNILVGCMLVKTIPSFLPDHFPNKNVVLTDIDDIANSLGLGIEVCRGYTSYLQDIDAPEDVQSIIPLLQPIDIYSKQFGGEIVKQVSSELPLINCKGSQIKRVVVNLFMNARQALESQEDQVVTIKTWSGDDQVFLSVGDNGKGISPDVLPHIFDERFTTKDNGTGLGLFMVKEIVENHHGTVTVHTAEGKGTTFLLAFPAVKL